MIEYYYGKTSILRKRSVNMKKTKSTLRNIIVFNFVLFVALGIYANTFNTTAQSQVKQIVYSELLDKIEENKDEKMSIVEKDDGSVIFQVEKEKTIYMASVPKENKIGEYSEKYEINYKRGEKTKTIGDYISGFFTLLIPIAFILFVFAIFSGQRQAVGKADSLTKTNSKKDKIPNVKMEDIGGLSPETKREVKNMIETFKNGEEALKYDIRPLKGSIFHGPPGTGKTLLAKAVAHELQASFFSISGSSFAEMYVGVGASRVRKLFEEARKNAPSLIFIDEADAVAGKRGGFNKNEEREATLNELLVQLDGIQANEKVLVLAATNRVDMLDEAFLRPGRFDLKIMIDLPDLDGRKEIIKIHTKKKPLSQKVIDKLDDIAKDTYGYSGAEIEGLFLAAANNAFSMKKKEIDMEDIDYAIERTLLGSAGRKLSREDTKKRVAYHEAGHALVGALTKPGSIRKATIVPRGQALGFVSHTPDELNLSTYSELSKRIQTILAGGVAEMKIFGEHSVGVGGDVQQAKDLIGKMVDLGMGDGDFVLTFDEKNKNQKMQQIFNEALGQCKKLIDEHIVQFENLTKALMEKETLDGPEVENIVFETTDKENKKETSEE